MNGRRRRRFTSREERETLQLSRARLYPFVVVSVTLASGVRVEARFHLRETAEDLHHFMCDLVGKDLIGDGFDLFLRSPDLGLVPLAPLHESLETLGLQVPATSVVLKWRATLPSRTPEALHQAVFFFLEQQDKQGGAALAGTREEQPRVPSGVSLGALRAQRHAESPQVASVQEQETNDSDPKN